MESLMEINTKSEARDRLNTWVAISVALLASFMAVTKVKDDNIVQAMLQAKSDAVDTWGEYQAKKIKQHLTELGRDQDKILRLSAPPAAVSVIDEQIKHAESEIARYQKEETALRDKAQAHEKAYDDLNYRD